MEFKPVDLQDDHLLQPFFHLTTEGICEYNTNIMYLWYNVYKTHFCIEDDILFLKQDYKGREYALMPICKPNDYKKAFDHMQDHINASGYPLEMYCVEPEFAQFVEEHYEEHFEVYPDRDSFDYIYEGDALRLLKGKKYHKKRNHINAFKKDFDKRYLYKRLSAEDKEDCCELLKKWRTQKTDSPYDQIQGEILGIKRVFEHLEESNVKVGGIYIDGQLEAFSMGSYLNSKKEMAVIHVEKANPDIRGLYPMINQEFLLAEFPDVPFVNREEDLGIEGIRQAKLTYRPIRFAEKYNITERVE
ncbi:DUF2156 domain-containing protein [Vallitalea okinawensis]|uniref:DUF2156 domain-containing protein n=1 Tax=Vallitalea okinawensis TaxID=2078660 RepID=UPI001300BA4C|nr:phosphatidylglycerol lysyltransferase domain-containing protein [Vallitalea okinawensis]